MEKSIAAVSISDMDIDRIRRATLVVIPPARFEEVANPSFPSISWTFFASLSAASHSLVGLFAALSSGVAYLCGLLVASLDLSCVAIKVSMKSSTARSISSSFSLPSLESVYFLMTF